jgi:hypothetical protein
LGRFGPLWAALGHFGPLWGQLWAIFQQQFRLSIFKSSMKDTSSLLKKKQRLLSSKPGANPPKHDFLNFCIYL